MKIKYRLLSFLIPLAILPVLGIGVIVYNIARDALRDQIFERLEVIATNAERQLHGLLRQYSERISPIATRQSVRRHLRNHGQARDNKDRLEVKVQLDTILDSSASFRRLSLVRRDGKVLVSTDPTYAGTNITAQLNNFRTADAHDQTRIALIKRSTGELELQLMNPILTEEETLGMIVLEASAEELSAISDRSRKLGYTAELVLAKWDESANTLALVSFDDKSTRISEVQAIDPAYAPMIKALAQRQDSFGDNFYYQGKAVFSAMRHIEPLGWGLLLKIDQAEALRPVRNLGYISLSVAVAIALLAALFSIKFSCWLSRDFDALTAGVQKITRGDLSQTVTANSSIELAQLAQAFNMMSVSLGETRKDLETSLHDLALREESLRMFVSSSLDAIIEMDCGGAIIEWNPAAEKLFGHKREDAIGKSLAATIIPERYRERHSLSLKRYLDNGETTAIGKRLEIEALTANGSEIPVELTVTAIKRGAQDTLFNGVIRDLQDRRAAERADHLLTSIARQSADAIIGMDLAGKVTAWNSAAERLYGYTQKEMIGRSLSAIAPKDLLPEADKMLGKVLSGETIQEFITQRLRKDGKVIWVSISKNALLDRAGKIYGVSSIRRDVTEKLLSEKQLRKSLHEKELLLKEIHHRVKNNLQVISSLLRLQASYGDGRQVRELMEESGARVRSMALVHERLYRSETLGSIDFGAYLEELALELMRSHRGSDQLRLHLEIEPVEIDIAKAVPCGLLVNELITNALKHAFVPGGEGDIWIKLHATDRHVELVVADNGQGFPDDADLAKSRSLGLELVRILTDQLKGKLELSRSSGTEFRLRFEVTNEQVGL